MGFIQEPFAFQLDFENLDKNYKSSIIKFKVSRKHENLFLNDFGLNGTTVHLVFSLYIRKIFF